MQLERRRARPADRDHAGRRVPALRDATRRRPIGSAAPGRVRGVVSIRPAPAGRSSALRAFEAAARHLNFREAGDELCVTHSAISHHVKELERELGGPLFWRKGRRVELTEAGAMLFPVLRDAFARIGETTAHLRQRAHRRRAHRPGLCHRRLALAAAPAPPLRGRQPRAAAAPQHEPSHLGFRRRERRRRHDLSRAAARDTA